MSLGEQIFNLRKNKGISQEKLAELVGVSRQTVHKWENDSIQPNAENILLLSNVLGVNSKELLSLIYPINIVNGCNLNTNEGNENKERVEILAVVSDEKASRKTFFLYGNILSAIFALLFLVLVVIDVCMGILLSSAQTGDMQSWNYNINENIFIIMIVISFVLFLLELIYILLMIKYHKKRK